MPVNYYHEHGSSRGQAGLLEHTIGLSFVTTGLTIDVPVRMSRIIGWTFTAGVEAAADERFSSADCNGTKVFEVPSDRVFTLTRAASSPTSGLSGILRIWGE